MDKSELGKDAREEVTRESLIAISYSLPDNNKQPLVSKLSSHADNLVDSDADADGADKYRSQLISISYSASPDTKPVTRPET